MAPQTSTRLTYEDLLELPDDGKQYELIDGELVVNPAPVLRHQRIVIRIVTRFESYLGDDSRGIVYIAPTDVVLADDVVLQPDVVVVLPDRVEILTQTHIAGAPNLVVEVISDRTRRRDELVKRRLYEQYGVDEYWIVDPAIDTVKIYRRSGTSFARVAEISREAGGAITSPLLPGFELDINVVFDV